MVGIKRTILLLASFGLVVVLASEVAFVSFGAPQASGQERPNILLVVTDDLDDRPGSIAGMENLRSLVANRGVDLQNAYVTQALCCPSRASMLRGQYPHNTGVTANTGGDYADFASSGKEASTFATWIHGAGYQTAYFGKYLNGYGSTRIPAGWDRWFGDVGRAKEQNFNDQGRLVRFDPKRHLFEDVLREKAVGWLKNRDTSSPFLAVLSTHAPHTPATPAPRHADLFPGAELPKPASFDEKRVSDKNGWVRQQTLSRAQIDEMEDLYRDRLRVMEGVDEMLGAVLSELAAQGELDNTYVFFTSDNGFHFGEHRFQYGKETPYQEDVAVPMIVSGPGVAADATRQHLVLNQDLAPTFADIAEAPAPGFVDGRSFLPVLEKGAPAASSWREAFLVESPRTSTGWLERMPSNLAVRTARYELIDYAEGKDEFYDMKKDPHQMRNIIANPPGGVLARLRGKLGRLEDCAGRTCVRAER